MSAGADRLAPGWRGLVLLCRECEDRRDGPDAVRAKEVRRLLKALPPTGAETGKLKVVQSGCLGLCPKKAIAVVVACGGAPLTVAAVRHAADAVPLVGSAQA